MKRTAYFILMLFFLTAIPSYSEFENSPITDNAEYLLKYEITTLSKAFNKLREEYDFEIAVYTEPHIASSSAETRANFIYDTNKYGTGENRDGILLYICSENGDYHFVLRGKALTSFNSNRMAYLERKTIIPFTDGNYYEAFKAYVETVEELLQMTSGVSDDVDNHPLTSKHYPLIILGFVVLLLVALTLLKNKKTNKN